ncbi:unnamed protein product [Tuber aestivum]|uniref:Uncharacterized protein n=1 Tax=Tuber aestivum TaxID=59557 RepID=A0A292Q0U4_9PEZI|nr:unnamed protein product [Tuber aestivum]
MSVIINQCPPPTPSISTVADTTDPVPSDCGHPTGCCRCSVVYQPSLPASDTVTEPDTWGLKVVTKGGGRTQRSILASRNSSPPPLRWGASLAVVRIATRMPRERHRSPPSSRDEGEGCSASDTASEGSYDSDGCFRSDAASEAEIS